MNTIPKTAIPVRKICSQCKQPGHFKRKCPVKQQSFSGGENTPTQMNGQVVVFRSAYIAVNVGYHRRWCLLNISSEFPIIPARFMSNNNLKPSVQTLNAANGTAKPVVGGADVLLEIGSLFITISCLVSEHVDKLLLGVSLLE